jgi:hypothetical protein
VKIGRSSGNHGNVTKPASASRGGNFIKGSKDETEILVKACQCCYLKNLANPIEKKLNGCAVTSQIVEYSSESCPILLNSSRHFQRSTYLHIRFHTDSRGLQRDSYQRNVSHMREVAVPGTDQAIFPLKSQNSARFTK